jgi:hypothetical protein
MPMSCARRGAADDLRRRPDGEARTLRPAVDHVVRDFCPGVPRADDEDVAVAKRSGIHVLRRVDQLAAEAFATGP